MAVYVGRFCVRETGTKEKPVLEISSVSKKNIEEDNLKYKTLVKSPMEVYYTHYKYYGGRDGDELREGDTMHVCDFSKVCDLAGAYEILSEKEELDEKEQSLKRYLAGALFGGALGERNVESVHSKMLAVIDKKDLKAKYDMGRDLVKKREEKELQEKENKALRKDKIKDGVVKIVQAPLKLLEFAAGVVGVAFLYVFSKVSTVVARIENKINNARNARQNNKIEKTEREFLEN